MDRKTTDRFDSLEGFSTLDREMYENPLVFAEAPMDEAESFGPDSPTDQEEREGLDGWDEAQATEEAYDRLATGWCG
jgi:hypothetical protein